MPRVSLFLTKRSLADRVGVSVSVVTRLQREGHVTPDAMLETGKALVPVFYPWQAAIVLRHTQAPTRLS